MPFGISVAPEEFQRRVDEALSDLPGVSAVHDDIILWGEGVSDKGGGDHDEHLAALLQKCREKRIQLNKEKVELKQREITYLGHILSREGLRPAKRIAAVQQLPTPESKQDVQGLLRVVGYL